MNQNEKIAFEKKEVIFQKQKLETLDKSSKVKHDKKRSKVPYILASID